MEILNLAEITVEVSALILFISLIRALFRKKSNPNVRYFLWIFVALRVLLPFKLDFAVEMPDNWNRIPFPGTEQNGPEEEQIGRAHV